MDLNRRAAAESTAVAHWRISWEAAFIAVRRKHSITGADSDISSRNFFSDPLQTQIGSNQLRHGREYRTVVGRELAFELFEATLDRFFGHDSASFLIQLGA